MTHRNTWPDGKRLAFTVIDDTDNATLENVGPVYAFLADCGFRTTKSVWAVAGDPQRGKYAAPTCDDPAYLQWALDLQAKGFEIGLHNCTWHGLPRDEIRSALNLFAARLGHDPVTAANHTGVEDSIYWGDARLTGWHAGLYNLLTRFRNRKIYRGHVEGDPHFWGDFCRERIKYYRSFTFRDVDTLNACPFMPYHDPLRPYVNYWFAASNGQDVDSFNRCLSEANQDRLEQEGGACIMYTHFASGFYRDGQLDARFRQLMMRLSRKNGWFVPVATLLDHMLADGGHREISDAERRSLEMKWLLEKLLLGTT
jgi:hypothetical protein